MHQQHTPSPHNSPIYDWAKLLSMRRIKSRAGQEKSAGVGCTREPRTAPHFGAARSRLISSPISLLWLVPRSPIFRCTTFLSLNFSFVVRTWKICEKLNMAKSRSCVSTSLPSRQDAPISTTLEHQKGCADSAALITK